MSRFTTDLKYGLVQFFRHWPSVFFAFVFPVILLLVLGYLFGGQSGLLTLYYADGDGSPESRELLHSLRAAGAVDLRDGAGTDLARMLREGKIAAYVEIPAGFGESVTAVSAGNVSGRAVRVYHGASGADAALAISLVRQTVDRYNLDAAGNPRAIALKETDVAAAGMSYVEYLLPGILGMCIMFSAVNGTLGAVAQYRTTGAFQKLTMTPLSNIEWNAARTLSGTVLVLLSVALSLLVAWLALGCTPAINVVSFLMLVVGSFIFVGLGMVVTYVIEDVEAANSTSFLVIVPLVIISGSFFPVNQLPCFLQFLSILSPLTYLNNGLRSSMITLDYADAILNLLVCCFLALLLFCIAVGILMSKEGQDY